MAVGHSSAIADLYQSSGGRLPPPIAFRLHDNSGNLHYACRSRQIISARIAAL